MTWETDGRPGAVERAFELARSGACNNLSSLRDRLGTEGYSVRQIDGPVLLRQLRELIRIAREDQPKEPAR